MPNPITGPSTVCQGSTIALSTTSTGGTWSSSNPAVASVLPSGLVIGVSGGTAVISYSYPAATGGCASTKTVTVIGRAYACVSFGSSPACGGCWAATVTGTPGATITYHYEDCSHTILLSGLTAPANAVIAFSSMPGTTCYLCIDQVSISGCTWSGCNCPTGPCCAPVQGHRDANPNSGTTPGGITSIDFSNVNVVPNPNKGTFAITGAFADQATSTTIQVEIVDMLGKVLYSDAVKVENGEINTTISLDDNIANGIYLLRLKSEGSSKVMKFSLDR
jgi:hypothetical protein